MTAELASQFGILETLAVQLRSTPGVTAVSIRSGRRSTDYGTPVGPPRATCSLGTGLSVEVWGTDSPFIDSMLELARLIDHREQEIEDLTEALTQANDRQLRLFELGRLNVDSLDRDSTVERVLHHGLDLTESSCIAIIGREHETRWLVPDSELVPTWLIEAGRDAIVTGGYRKVSVGAGRHALLARVAVVGSDLVLAVGREAGAPYGTAERKVLDSLAGSLSGALRLVDLHEAALRQAIVENEHATAAALASAVLPKELPAVNGVDAFARSMPARSVGGDYYTAVAVGDSLCFAIGDVAGKGLPAAVLMTNAITSTNTVFRAARAKSAVQLLGEIHDALDAFLVGVSRFITMVVGIATPDPMRPGEIELRLANAGHSPVLVARNGSATHVPPVAPPVGVSSRPSGEDFVVVLRSGDVFLTGSDGLTEQEAPSGEMFGTDRLESTLRRSIGTATSRSIAEGVFAAVSEFGSGAPRSDDQTVFTLRSSWEESMTVDEAGLCRLTMEADLLAVRELAVWLPESVEALAGPDAVQLIGPIELSIHELCINIVEHAYAGKTGRVRIELRLERGELVFDIFDDGVGFDPALVNHPDPEVPTIRGYGLMIIRQLASSVHYARRDDRNHWEIRFSATPPA